MAVAAFVMPRTTRPWALERHRTWSHDTVSARRGRQRPILADSGATLAMNGPASVEVAPKFHRCLSPDSAEIASHFDNPRPTLAEGRARDRFRSNSAKMWPMFDQFRPKMVIPSNPAKISDQVPPNSVSAAPQLVDSGPNLADNSPRLPNFRRVRPKIARFAQGKCKTHARKMPRHRTRGADSGGQAGKVAEKRPELRREDLSGSRPK